MKYVKTKDGRIFEKKYLTYEELVNTWYYHGCFVNDGEAIAEADTIEELIDEYIVKGISVSTVSKSDLFRGEDGSWLKEIGLPKHKVKIYGCTFVELSNGAYRLEPVAKMNGKGELKLL